MKYLILNFLIVFANVVLTRKKHLPVMNDEMVPYRNRTTECVFGNEIKLVNTSWFLGIGLGPLEKTKCLKCRCLPMKRKKKSIAVVHCHNFKHQCSVPSCKNPISLPNECCKKCPYEVYSSNSEEVHQKSENGLKLCNYNGQVFHTNTQWISNSDPCTKCFCQNGKVKCDIIECPRLRCNRNESVEYKTTECCPFCKGLKDNEKALGCYLGDYFYTAGTKWHPYLVPTGYEKCTTCYCDHNLKVQCSRIDCQLHCKDLIPNYVLLSSDRKLCCSKCSNDNQPRVHLSNGLTINRKSYHRFQPITPILQKNTSLMSGKSDDLEGSCRSPSGLMLRNGFKYHPILYNRLEKYIICECKNTVLSCTRQRLSKKLRRRNSKKRN